MTYKPGIHRLTRSDYDALVTEIERLRAELKGALEELYNANQERHRAYLAKDSFPTESQRRMLDAAPGPRWPAKE